MQVLIDYMEDVRMQLANDVYEDGITPQEFLDLRKKVDGDEVGAYVIYNITQDKAYVGQATRLFYRVNQHLAGHGNGDVYADMKYGDDFRIRLYPLAESGYRDLDKLEKDLIARYDAAAPHTSC